MRTLPPRPFVLYKTQPHTYYNSHLTQLLFLVPTPSVTISTPGDLYIGAPLTLTCDVDFDPTLASIVNVSVIWLRGVSPLFNATDHVSIISSLLDSQFTSNLTLYPLSTADSTNFTCRAGITPSGGLTSSLTASDLGEDTVSVQIILRGELVVIITE